MKGGLAGGTLSVAPKSELEEAHAHVACWIGSGSTPGRKRALRRERGARAAGVRNHVDRGDLAVRDGDTPSPRRSARDWLRRPRQMGSLLLEFGCQLFVTSPRRGVSPE